MTVTRQLQIIARQIQHGRWKFARMLIGNTAYGLTHRRCRQCRNLKGLSIHARCFLCQFNNLAAAMACDYCGCSPFIDPAGCGCDCHVEEE